MNSVMDAAYRLVSEYPGGAASLGPRLGKNQHTLSNEVRGEGTAKFGLLDAVLATVMTRDLRILNAFAAEAGCVVLPMPQIPQDADTAIALAGVMRETADFCTAVAVSMEDGNVTQNELARIDLEVQELIARVQAVRGRMAALYTAEHPNGDTRPVRISKQHR